MREIAVMLQYIKILLWKYTSQTSEVYNIVFHFLGLDNVFCCRHTHHPYFCIVRNSNTGLSQESLPFHLTLRGR